MAVVLLKPYRTLVAATAFESILAHSGIIDIRKVIFHYSFLLRFPPEIWRIFTSFLLTGGGLSFVFDLYFRTPARSPLPEDKLNISVYTYSNALERQSGRFGTPGDFFTYVAFVASTILVSFEAQILI